MEKMENFSVYIAGRNIEEFGAHMQQFPSFGPDISADVFRGRMRSSMQPLSCYVSAQWLICTIDYHGDLQERTKNRSALEALMLAKSSCVIDYGDGYWYNAVLYSVSTGQSDGDVSMTVGYKFQATRHKDTVKMQIEDSEFSMLCRSNVPLTDCKITLPRDALTSDIVRPVFTVAQDDFILPMNITGDIVLDGINKVFTMGNRNITTQSDFVWSTFPALRPGENSISLFVEGYPYPAYRVPVTIEYTPTYY